MSARTLYVIGIALGFVMGFATNQLTWLWTTPDTSACARQHNVYACELVAVPKAAEPKP